MSDFVVRPAFAGRLGMVGFLFALVAVLTGPYLVHWLIKPDAQSVYRTMPPRYGAYTLVSEVIEQGRPIDILIVGSSRSLTALDPVTIGQQIRDRFGEDINIVNLSYNWRGDELYYRLVKVILARLPVRMVVWPETGATPSRAHPLAHFLWLAPEEDLAGATFELDRRAGLYGASMLGVSRHLWGTAFPHPEISRRYGKNVDKKRKSRGFQAERRGWKSRHDGLPAREFVEIREFPFPEISTSEMIFNGEYTGSFRRAKPYSSYQTYFLRRLAELCRQYDTRFVSVEIPVHFDGRTVKSHLGIRDLTDKRPRTWPTVGVPQSKLFEAIDLEEVKAYYKNANHLNLNGGRFYSVVIAPALWKLLAAKSVD